MSTVPVEASAVTTGAAVPLETDAVGWFTRTLWAVGDVLSAAWRAIARRVEPVRVVPGEVLAVRRELAALPAGDWTTAELAALRDPGAAIEVTAVGRTVIPAPRRPDSGRPSRHGLPYVDDSHAAEVMA